MIMIEFNGRLTDHKAVNDLIFSHALLFGYNEDGVAQVIFGDKSAEEVLELVKPAIKKAVIELALSTTMSLSDWKPVSTTLVTFGVDKSMIINRLD